MSSDAELTLVINARNLADGVVKNFGASLGKVASAAETAGGRIKGAFHSVSSGITNGLGNLTESLAQGAGLGESMFAFGTYMAGQAAESMIGGLIEKMAGSSLMAAVGAPIAAAGSAVGGLMAAAVPIGMALLPVLLVAAIVAAIVFLINNPTIVDNILSFAGGIVKTIIDGLVALPGFLLDTFGAAWQGVVDAIGPFVTAIVDWFLGIPGKLVALGGSIVTTIIDGLASFPGKVADVVREAFTNLKIDIGPFHIRSTGVTIDLPEISAPGENRNPYPKNHAMGGWAGLRGPELIRVGELGPEYIRKAGTGTGDESGGGGAAHGHEFVVMLDGEKVGRAIDKRLARTYGMAPARVGA